MNSTLRSYVNAIRFYINDYPTTNALLGEEESGDGKIMLAINMTLDDFNTSCPWSANYTVDNFPSFSLLIEGAVIHLLRSAGILQSRNHLNYSAGGLSVGIWDKAKDYLMWMRDLQQKYEMEKASLIRRLNIAKAMRRLPQGVNSDYYLMGFDAEYLSS